MTAREKASQLIVNYQLRCTSLGYPQAKQCALIAVDEILTALPEDYQNDIWSYWEQVKSELYSL